MIAFHWGSSSTGSGDDGPSAWPSSHDNPETAELHRYGLHVLPGCHLPRHWKIDKYGYPTLGPGATPEELRTHPSGRLCLCMRARVH